MLIDIDNDILFEVLKVITTMVKDAWGVIYPAFNQSAKSFLVHDKNTFYIKSSGNIYSEYHSIVIHNIKDHKLFKIKKLEHRNNSDIEICIEPKTKEGLQIDGQKADKPIKIVNGRCEIFVESKNLKLIFEALCDVSENDDLKEIGSDYRIISKLGRGGFGVVYKGICTKDHTFCAIKTDKDLKRSKLHQEYIMVKSLQHENVIRFLDYKVFGHRQFLVLELAEGASLSQRISTSKEGLDESITKHIFYQVLEGLSFIHSKGALHRDIKPENIVLMSLEDYPTAKIIDFGLSCFNNAHDINRVVGAYRFLAPELLIKYTWAESHRLRKVHYTNKVDVWSFGCCLFMTLTTILPYEYDRKDLALYRHRMQDNLIQKDSESYKKLSLKARKVIHDALTFEDYQRPTVDSLLNYSWFQKN